MDAIKKRLREMMIPPYADRMTLPTMGLRSLRQIVAAREYRTQDGLRSFLLSTRSTASDAWLATASAVFAKELNLDKTNAFFTNVHSLIREVGLLGLGKLDDGGWPIFSKDWSGYLFVCDTHTEHLPSESQAWLCDYLAAGGGVVLCTTPTGIIGASPLLSSYLSNAFTTLDCNV